MIESLLRIGEVAPRSEYCFNLAPLPKAKGNKEAELGVVIFDADREKVVLRTQTLTGHLAEEYLWVGNTGGEGTNAPSPYVTTTDLSHVLGFKATGDDKIEQISEHKNALLVLEKEIDEALANSSPEGMRELGELTRYVTVTVKWYNLWLNSLKDMRGDALRSELSARIERFLDKGVWKKDLYTIAVVFEGKEVELAKLPGYLRLLTYHLCDKRQETVEGICQICGANRVLVDPAYPPGTLLNMYNKDKIGFRPGLDSSDEGLARAHALCPSCKNKILAGQYYVTKNLVAHIGGSGGLSVYVIPSFVPNITKEALESLKIDEQGWILKSLNWLKSEEKHANEEVKGTGGYYMLTLVFGARQQSHFAYYRMLEDIPEGKLIQLAKEYQAFRGYLKDYLNVPENREWFNALYGCIPLKKGTPDRFLDITEALLEGYKTDEGMLLKDFLDVLKCIRFGTCSALFDNLAYLNGAGDAELVNVVLLQNVFIGYFKSVGMIGYSSEQKRTESSEEQALQTGSQTGISDFDSFFKRFSYNDKQKALFMLGALVAEIGREQWKKNDRKKSILDKLNFEGMSEDRVLLLSNRLMESLRDYDLLADDEPLYVSMHEFLERQKGQLKDPVENVFYILSGYSYQTAKYLKAGAAKSHERN